MGEAECKFYVHKSVVSRSEFFEKALKSEWKEGQGRRILLPEDDPETFQAYLHWVYTGRIYSGQKPSYVVLAKSYAWAEKLLDKELKDRLLDAMVTTCRERDEKGLRNFPGTDAISIIYAATTESSPARRMMVDMYVSHGAESWTVSVEHGIELLVDVTKALLPECTISDGKKHNKYSEIDRGSPCSYHHHDKDKPCSGKTP